MSSCNTSILYKSSNISHQKYLEEATAELVTNS